MVGYPSYITPYYLIGGFIMGYILAILMVFIFMSSYFYLKCERLRIKNSALNTDCLVYRNILMTNGFSADLVDRTLSDEGVRRSLEDLL